MKTATETIEMPYDAFVELVKTLTLGEVMSLRNFFIMKFNEVNAVVKSLENKLVDSKSKNDTESVKSCEDHIKRLVYSEKCLEDKIAHLKEVISSRKIVL